MVVYSRKIAVIASTKTGDFAHIAGAAALDDNLDILVLAPGDSDPVSLKEVMEYFEHASGCQLYTKDTAKDTSTPDRVRFFKVEDAIKPNEKTQTYTVESKLADDRQVPVKETADKLQRLKTVLIVDKYKVIIKRKIYVYGS
jgi:hypothetical protein